MKKLVLLCFLFVNLFANDYIKRAEYKIGDCSSLVGNYQKLKACNKADLQAWDELLNKEYKLLMKDEYLSKEFKDNLKAAQLAWIKYRDLAAKSINLYFASQDGSIYRNELAGISDFEIIKLTKNRALELCSLRFSTYLASEDDFECGESEYASDY